MSLLNSERVISHPALALVLCNPPSFTVISNQLLLFRELVSYLGKYSAKKIMYRELFILSHQIVFRRFYENCRAECSSEVGMVGNHTRIHTSITFVQELDAKGSRVFLIGHL